MSLVDIEAEMTELHTLLLTVTADESEQISELLPSEGTSAVKSEKYDHVSHLGTLLPKGFKYEIKSCEADLNKGTEGFRAVIHTDCKSGKMCMKWVSEFNLSSFCTWRVRRTYPNDMRGIVYRRDYVCQHSGFNKTHKSVKRRTKDTGCPAKMSIKIKKVNRWNVRDVYLSQGLVCIVSLRWTHNHDFTTANVLYYRPPPSHLKESFMAYFNEGMSPAAAMKYHRDSLRMADNFDEQKLLDSSVNPQSRTVYNWYDTWKKSLSSLSDPLYDITTDTVAGEVQPTTNVSTERVAQNNDDIDVDMQIDSDDDSDADATEFSTPLFDEFVHLMSINYVRFGSDPACQAAMQKAIDRLRTVSSAGKFVSFLRNGVRVRRRVADASAQTQDQDVAEADCLPMMFHSIVSE